MPNFITVIYMIWFVHSNSYNSICVLFSIYFDTKWKILLSQYLLFSVLNKLWALVLLMFCKGTIYIFCRKFRTSSLIFIINIYLVSQALDLWTKLFAHFLDIINFLIVSRSHSFQRNVDALFMPVILVYKFHLHWYKFWRLYYWYGRQPLIGEDKLILSHKEDQ